MLMPMPVSDTRTVITPPINFMDTPISPCDGVNFMAFDRRLSHTCCMSRALPSNLTDGSSELIVISFADHSRSRRIMHSFICRSRL